MRIEQGGENTLLVGATFYIEQMVHFGWNYSLNFIHNIRQETSSKASEVQFRSTGGLHDDGPRLHCRYAVVVARSLAQWGLSDGCVLLGHQQNKRADKMRKKVSRFLLCAGAVFLWQTLSTPAGICRAGVVSLAKCVKSQVHCYSFHPLHCLLFAAVE